MRNRCGALLWLALLVSPSTQAMTLQEALERSLTYDPAVATSLALTATEREAARQDRLSLYPTLAVMGSAAYQDRRIESDFFSAGGPGGAGGAFSERFGSWNAFIEARQPLFRGDWFQRIDRGDALDSRALASQDDRRLTLIGRGADRYFGVLLAEAEQALAIAEREAVQASLNDTQQRYDVGQVPRTDLIEAEARLDLAEARILAAEQSVSDARDLLDELTGMGDARLPRLSDEVRFEPLTPATVDDWVVIAMERSPLIQVARLDLKISEFEARSRKAERGPSADVFVNYGRDDTSASLIGQKADAGTVGLEVSMPLYSRVSQSRVAEARNRSVQLQAQLERTQGEVAVEARSAFRAYAVSARQTEAFDRVRKSARSAEEAVKNGFEAGNRTITDVLNAQQAVAQAERDWIRARYGQLLALIALKRASGVLTMADVIQLDTLLSYPES